MGAAVEIADQIVAQADQLDYRYLSATENRRLFSVSSQHYDFASEGFARLVSEKKEESLNFRFLETSTSKVMEDVRDAVSEVGFIYLNDFNGKVIKQYLEGGKRVSYGARAIAKGGINSLPKMVFNGGAGEAVSMARSNLRNIPRG